jgi:hypothetical protein
MISQLVEASATIDWHKVRGVLNAHSTSSVQPPAPADFMLALRRNFSARALLLPGLIHIRRSPYHSQKLSENLAVAVWALAQFPRRTTDQSPEPEKTAISAMAGDEPAERAK